MVLSVPSGPWVCSAEALFVGGFEGAGLGE